jgi:4-aminobutyrate aminotransferase-like enzyme
MVTVAKPLAAGLPLGARSPPTVASGMHPRMHGDFAAARSPVPSRLNSARLDGLLIHVAELGWCFLSLLRALQSKHSCVKVRYRADAHSTSIPQM